MGGTVVIGAGLVGLTCAYALRRRGLAVTVLDKGPDANCSTGNAGWVTPVLSEPLPAPGLVATSLRWMLRSDSPLYIRPWAVPRLAPWLWQFWRHCNPRAFAAGTEALVNLNRRTMPLFDALAADGVRFEMHRAGLILAFLEQRNAHRFMAAAEVLEQHGYPLPRLISGDDAADLEPGLAGRVAAAIVAEGERHVRPETLLDGLRARLEAMGVTFRLDARVTGFRRRGPEVTAVETDRGPVDADRVLLAAGAWSGAVSGWLGVRLPVQAGKGYSITVEGSDEEGGGGASGAGGPAPGTRPLYLYEARVAYSPFVGGFRLAGTMELSGINLTLDPRRVDAIRRGARRFLRLPAPTFGGYPACGGCPGRARPWVGMRPITPDGLPLIGRMPGTDNAFVATGHGTKGVTLAPATAEAIAALMTGGEPPADLRPFDPARFLR